MDRLYCTYVKAIEKIPQKLLDEKKDEVKSLFYDVNQRIREYDQQYQVLLKELGVLCPMGATKQDSINYFFKTINDYLQLGLTTYSHDPEKKKVFADVTELMNKFLKKEIFDFEQAQPLEKALLVQITKSAWVLTNPEKSMNKVAVQLGGKLKNKTRKNKH